MAAEKQKKQGGAPPMPGGGMGGMGGMDYPQLEFSLSATASGRPCGSVVSNFEQLCRTAHVILLYTFRGRRGFGTRISTAIGALPLSLPRLLERLFMQIPLQVMFENAEPSEAVRAVIGHEVERLERYQHHITGCRVAVVAPSRKHRHGEVYRINIWVTIPPHGNIVASHQPSGDRGHVHVEVAIKDAFAAARRQIEALAQRASGKVKLHEVEAHGRVSKISAEEDYGLHRNTG